MSPDTDDLTTVHDEAESARQDLADTVAALAERADVRARARDKAQRVRAHTAARLNTVSPQLGTRILYRTTPGTAVAVGAIVLIATAVLVRRRGERTDS